MPEDTERQRPRGILSPADRRYLSNSEEYADRHSRQSVKERKDAIRERVRHSMLDISFLVDDLPDGLLREALAADDDRDPAEALPDLVSLLYQLDESEYQLERLIEAGVERVRRNQGDSVKARVSIDLSPDEVVGSRAGELIFREE